MPTTRSLALRVAAAIAFACPCACATGESTRDRPPDGATPEVNEDDDDGRAFVEPTDEVLDVGLPALPDLGSIEASTSESSSGSSSEWTDESTDDGDSPAGFPSGDCCIPHATSKCEDIGVLACVCVHRPQCCQESWDASCVAAVDALDCGECE
jgi:hypothetical protein